MVDSSTTNVPSVRYLPTCLTPSIKAPKSGSRRAGSAKGVWIARVTASTSAILEKSDVHLNLSACTTLLISSSSPGSSPFNGLSPRFNISILKPEDAESRWKPHTRLKASKSANRTAAGMPTYPIPITPMFLIGPFSSSIFFR